MFDALHLSIEQLRALAENAERDSYEREVVRFKLRPSEFGDHAVHVETSAISFGDVVRGNSVVLRSGETLTVKQYDEFRARLAAV